jgi:hypothetical protein
MALQEEIGQSIVHACGPGRGRIRELHGIEQPRLQSKDSEEEVLVGMETGRGFRFAQLPPLPLLSNKETSDRAEAYQAESIVR